ncbi:MAG: glycosyltransferase family 39 protein [Candidatus Binataceae bacterium]|nr:glycosyltransferase family 39 protein [Candidatus Binataceae bacterium]
MLCAIAAAILYLPTLGGPALLEPDEGRYAEIAREMVVSGDDVTPRDDWVRYFEKPPLVYWATAGSISAFGSNEFSVRLPAAIFSIGQVALVAALGEAMFGASVGLLAALALALSSLFFGFAGFATLDPALAFFLTAAMAAFYRAVQSREASVSSRRWLRLSAAMLALGTLAKGPVAVVLGGAIAIGFMMIERRWREIARFPWLSGSIIYSAVVIPWFAIAESRNPGFLRFFILHEHVQRYLQSTEHGWGPYFLVIVAIAGTWPWFFFAISGAFNLLKNEPMEPEDRRSALIFLMLWFAVVLIFFSIPRSKLGSYMLPGLPPIAMLAGLGIAGFIATPFAGWKLRSFALINLIIAIALATTIALFARRIGAALVIDGEIAAAAIASVGIFSALATSRNRPRLAIAVIAVGVLIASGAGLKARRDAASFYSYRRLAQVITPYLASGCVLASYNHFVQSLPFYTGSREAIVGYRGELAPFSDSIDARASFIPNLAALKKLWQSPLCVVLIANFQDLPTLHRLTPTSVLGCEGKKLALYNRAVMVKPVKFECRNHARAVAGGAEAETELR